MTARTNDWYVTLEDIAVEPYYMQVPNHDALTANYIASNSEGFSLESL